MKNKNLNIAKMASTFGIIGLLAGIGLLFIGETLMGISCSIASVGISLIGFKTIKEFKEQVK